MRHRSLPRLMIEVPCTTDWRAMEPIAGDSRARHCRSCDKPVYDSKSMTRDELYDLITKTEGAPPCMQLHLRPDGTVVTKGCLAALWRTGRHLWLWAAALAVAFWAGVFGLRRACDPSPSPPWRWVRAYDDVQTMRGGLGRIVREPTDERPRWLTAPSTKVDPDRAEPLRWLQSQEDEVPPGWR
jgi:hypothetical protein